MIRPLLILFTALVTACTFEFRPDAGSSESGAETAMQTVRVDAELFYPERIALPGDSELLVAVDAVDVDGRRTITHFTTSLKGRQVPVPLNFSFETPAVDPPLHELNAAVFSNDRLLRLAGPVLIPGDVSSADLGRVRLETPGPAGFGQAWHCGRTPLQFGSVGEWPQLAMYERVFELERQPAASGVKYVVAGEPDTFVHEESGEIRVEHAGETLGDCRRAQPVQPPVSGGGNEPGWRVEVSKEQIRLTSNYGQSVREATLLHTGSRGWNTHFRGTDETGAILAGFRQTVCRDSATGMPHPYRVEVQGDGQRLTGCGGRPLDLLTEATWTVRQLDDEAIDEDIEMTLRFDADGRVSGTAACNRFSADFELGGEGLRIASIISTKMACTGTRDKLERSFFERLGAVQRFDIGEHGELVLIGPAGRIEAADLGEIGNDDA